MKLAVALLLWSSVACALPNVGDVLAPVNVSDTKGGKRALPDARYPIVVIYEDEKDEKENTRADAFIDHAMGLQANAGNIEGVPVADLEHWNWFPAKNFALAAVKKVERKQQSPLYTDFPGELRKRWGLAKSKASVVLLAPNGRVLFAAEGPLSDAQLQSFADTLAKLGVALPTQSAMWNRAMPTEGTKIQTP